MNIKRTLKKSLVCTFLFNQCIEPFECQCARHSSIHEFTAVSSRGAVGEMSSNWLQLISAFHIVQK